MLISKIKNKKNAGKLSLINQIAMLAKIPKKNKRREVITAKLTTSVGSRSI